MVEQSRLPQKILMLTLQLFLQMVKQVDGKVLIGGDWQGSGDLLQATYLNIDDATKISADALISGSGGTIVAWSNIKDENSLTKVSGALSAKGIDGDGGQIETSGNTLLYNNIKVTRVRKVVHTVIGCLTQLI